MSESRHLPHHQRSSSTGSHGLFFSTVSHPLSHGVNGLHHQAGHHHVGHYMLHHQASGSPDLLSELSDDEDWNDQNGSTSAPELQGIYFCFQLTGFFYRELGPLLKNVAYIYA